MELAYRVHHNPNYQLFLQPYDLGGCYRLALGIIAQRMKDLDSAQLRPNAQAWFERGSCRAWCEAIGLDFGAVMRQVEKRLDCPPLDYLRNEHAEYHGKRGRPRLRPLHQSKSDFSQLRIMETNDI
jgi:hypothetical protein